MPQFRYFAYLAVTFAVLLDLYSANPETDAFFRLALDTMALVFAVAGLSGLALGGHRR